MDRGRHVNQSMKKRERVHENERQYKELESKESLSCLLKEQGDNKRRELQVHLMHTVYSPSLNNNHRQRYICTTMRVTCVAGCLSLSLTLSLSVVFE